MPRSTSTKATTPTKKRSYTRKAKDLSFADGVVNWRNLFPTSYDFNDYGPITDKQALSIGSVYRAVDLISSTMGRTDCITYRDGGNNSRSWATDHPAFPLLYRYANEITPSNRFIETITANALLHSHGGFGYIQRGDDGQPIDLINLDSNHVKVVVVYRHNSLMPEVTYLATGVGSQGSSQEFVLRADEVIHLRSLGTGAGWLGHGLIDVACDTLHLARKASNFAQMYIDNSGVLQTVFNMGAFKTEDQKKEFLEQFNRRTGIGNAFKPIMMPPGWDVKTLPVNADQLALDALSDRLDRAVANFTGLPPHKVAVPGIGSSYGSIDAENQSMLGDVYDKWFVRLETELTLKLCTEVEKQTGKIKIEFDRSTLLASDPKSHEDRLINLYNADLISRDEARLDMNRPTVVNGHLKSETNADQQNQLVHAERTDVQRDEQ